MAQLEIEEVRRNIEVDGFTQPAKAHYQYESLAEARRIIMGDTPIHLISTRKMQAVIEIDEAMTALNEQFIKEVKKCQNK